MYLAIHDILHSYSIILIAVFFVCTAMSLTFQKSFAQRNKLFMVKTSIAIHNNELYVLISNILFCK